MVLSKIIHEVLNLKAANVQLRDILNFNRQKSVLEVQNFFILQEVYGYQVNINYFEPVITSLTNQRRKA